MSFNKSLEIRNNVNALDARGTGRTSESRRDEMRAIYTPMGDRIWHEDYSGSGTDPYITARVYRAEAMFVRAADIAR
jgi:hypothetical protein